MKVLTKTLGRTSGRGSARIIQTCACAELGGAVMTYVHARALNQTKPPKDSSMKLRQRYAAKLFIPSHTTCQLHAAGCY